MQKKKSYFLGIIGGLIGGFIGSVPWILMYVYANLIYSLLALLIAFGVLKGYQIFEGKIDKKLPWIIGIISFICLSISTLIIIPNLLILKEYGTLSWINFKILYTTKEFIGALMGDYILSLLFTILGISGAIKTLKYQVQNGEESINFFDNYLIDKKRIDEIKNDFLKHNAINKVNALSKEELENNISLEKTELKYLIRNDVIKVYRGRYYLNECFKDSRKKKVIISIILIIILFLTGLIVNIFTSDNNKKSIKPITYEIADTYKEYDYAENGDIGWSYLPKNDISGESGIIYVFYYDDETLNNEDAASLMEDIFKEENGYINSEKFINNNGHDVLYVEFDLDDYYAFYYYIFTENHYAFVEGSISQNVNNTKLRKDTRKIAETLTWK